MPLPIECWFDFASTYSYLSVMRLEEAAAPLGVPVHWKPVLLGPILREQGWASSPFLELPVKARYMWEQDLPRQSRKHGLPVLQGPPSAFPRSAVLPLRVALLGAEQQAPWVGAFCRALFQMNFIADREIDNEDAVAEALRSLDLPAGTLIDAARTDENKQRLRDQTAAASARGLFGAPTFFVGDAMFWGDDRLEDALALAGQGAPR